MKKTKKKKKKRKLAITLTKLLFNQSKILMKKHYL